MNNEALLNSLETSLAASRTHAPPSKEAHRSFDDEHHNCAICHDHEKLEKEKGIKSAVLEIHKDNGHKCADPSCDIEHEHSHIKTKVNSNPFPLWPLEDFIAHSKLPKWLREFTLNTSFLSPALITSQMLEAAPIPKTLKTWLSITAMHLLNRANKKLPRLGLTYAVAGAAQAGANSPLGSGFSRFIATSLIALIEKFSDNGHNHEKLSVSEMIKKESSTLIKNLSNKSKWTELWPSLVNIESKVQIVAPLVNKAVDLVTEKLEGAPKVLLGLFSKILGVSLSFVGTDRVLETLAKALGGKDSSFAASISSVCGCCGSPVCSAAATDMAISNSL